MSRSDYSRSASFLVQKSVCRLTLKFGGWADRVTFFLEGDFGGGGAVVVVVVVEDSGGGSGGRLVLEAGAGQLSHIRLATRHRDQEGVPYCHIANCNTEFLLYNASL
ncbi:hypothetical protein CDAR_562361 [Caerostris darwini]|uniref:Uncharacterized protein n=1 Tax=Caerostris darwini TaxID=1538125 RepID=A0AAV4X5R7_9ARAC|nr:hypothetical protein CDAR_562361 [Caerostris darwini]